MGLKAWTRPRRWLALMALALLLVSAYYAWQVHQARLFTRDTLIPRLATMDLPLRLSDLSPWQRQALLKVQDPSFHRHHGVDFTTPGQGLTTITQGLVKLLYFEKFQPGIAKIRQTLIAVYALDPMVGKDEQLGLFINLIGLGEGVHGFAEGARHYFHKEFAELGEEQYLALVAMIVAPKTFSLSRHPERNRERVERIQRLLAGQYQPKGLCDQYYGPLDPETQKGLAPFSYFDSYYR
ncbi:MAG: biosynthetic peptidoglycan transglycosylase [Pseudomonadota bacterium]